MTEQLLSCGLIGGIIFWLGGYVGHKAMHARASDLCLPRIIRILFGSPRSDGTLNAESVGAQLLGYLWVLLLVLTALRAIDVTTVTIIVTAGIVLFTLWSVRRTARD